MTQRVTVRVRTQSDRLNKPSKDGKSTYIPLPEAAKMLFLHESTIRYYVNKGSIKAFKHKRRWYICRDTIEALKKIYVK